MGKEFDIKLLAEQYKPENSWKTISEELFIRDCIPVALKYLTGKEVDTGYWTGTAGSIFNGVHVTRDGEPLFTSPPLALPARVEIGSEFVDAVHRIAKDKQGATLPSDSRLRQIFRKDSSKIKLRSFKAEMLNWIRIFTYYGITMTLVEDVPKLDEVNTEPAEEADTEWM